VTLEDGSQHPARLLAEKPEVDLAALRIQAAGLPAAWIADGRSLRPGQMVLAVGHPWGQPGFVTLGIISALEQTVARDGQPGVPIIRSDVKLAPGNSGGPLVNAAGAVVGINTMIIGGDQGVAIPSHVAHSFILSALGEQPGESRREAPAAEAAKEAVA
jgi:serine protease Do